MCGITVIVKDPNYSLSPKKVMEINDSVSHRGPDAFGSKFFLKKIQGIMIYLIKVEVIGI